MDPVLSWIDREPVLAKIGPVLVVVITYLAAKGVVDRDTSNLIVALATLLLGAGGVASARAAVWSKANLAALRSTGPAPGPSADRRD